MWTTATVADVSRKGEEVYGVLVYSGDAGEASKEDFRISQADLAANPKALERLALARLALFNAKTDFDAIQVGTTFDLRPKAVTPPTAAQLFFRNLSKLYALRAAVAAGIVPADDKNLSDLDAAVKAAFDTALVLEAAWPR